MYKLLINYKPSILIFLRFLLAAILLKVSSEMDGDPSKDMVCIFVSLLATEVRQSSLRVGKSFRSNVSRFVHPCDKFLNPSGVI